MKLPTRLLLATALLGSVGYGYSRLSRWINEPYIPEPSIYE